MHGLRSTFRPLLGVGVIALLLSTTGCVTSEKAAYVEHLTTTIAAGPAPNDDLAMAFGLNDYALPIMASAAVDTRGP